MTPATSLGFSAVDFAEQVIGLRLLPWQRWLLIHALELRPDRRFRFRTVLILVARQNGKTTVVEVKNLFKMFVLKVPLVIGTAQNLDISEESWDKAVEIVEGIPDLAAEVAHVDKTNGKKALKLTHGSRWKIAAASRKGGRGLSGDDVNLDELREHHTWDSWGAVTKTTMARANAQIFGFSNAGDDKSVVLNDLQAKGRAVAEQLVEFLAQMVVAEAESIAEAAAAEGIDTSLGLFEWSAPDNVKCTCAREDGDPHSLDCRLQDRQAWAMANPSLGYPQGISHEALASALSTDPEAIFRTECLCQRVPSLVDDRPITEEQWEALADAQSIRDGGVAIALDVTPDRSRAAIAVAGLRADGLMHWELIEHRPGTDWVVKRIAALKARHDPVAIAVDGKGPAASLITDLNKAGITESEDRDEPRRGDLVVTSAQDMANAFGMFIDAVRQETARHRDQAPLNAALAGAKTRALGDGGEAWGRKGSADISPLVTVTLAHYAYETRAHLLVGDGPPNVW